MNTILLRLIRPGVRPIMYASSLALPAGIIALHATYDMCSEFGVSPPERPSGKKRQVLYHFGPAGHERGPTAGSCKFAKRRIRGPDPRVSRKQLAGHGDPTRE